MATQTKVQTYRGRELKRAEEKLQVARDRFEDLEGRYKRGERIGPENTAPFAVSAPELADARAQLIKAEHTVEAWRLLTGQPTAGAYLVATTNISYDGRQILPGEVFVVPDDQVGVVVQLLEGGSAEVADPPAPPTAAAALGSAALRKRLGVIDERRQRRREALAEAEAKHARDAAALRQLQVSQELDGEKPPAGAIAKAEAHVSEVERDVRVKRAALEVELERTEADRQAYEIGLREAQALEAQSEQEALLSKAEAAMSEARRRTLRAYAELGNALVAERRIARELEQVVADIGQRAGMRMSRDVTIVDVDGFRSLSQIIEFLAQLRETKACGLVARVSRDHAGQEAYELVEVPA